MLKFITNEMNNRDINLILAQRAYGISRGKGLLPKEKIQHWVKKGHTSPLEFANYIFLIDPGMFSWESFSLNSWKLGGYALTKHKDGRFLFSCNARTIRNMVEMDMLIGHHIMNLIGDANLELFGDLHFKRVRVGLGVDFYQDCEISDEAYDHVVYVYEADISRACSHQLVRHRKASYMQESQRYVKYDNPKFHVPDIEKTKTLNDALVHAVGVYQWLVDQDVPIEDARYILPNGMATKVMFAMNGYWRSHFIGLRNTEHAQAEIREMAKEM